MIRRLVLAFPMALLFASCGGNAAAAHPDAGTVALSCTQDQKEMHLGVHIVDSGGHSISGAEVTARNTDTGKTITATSNDDGETVAVGTSLGSGNIQVVARFGTAQTDPCSSTFTCDGCSCVMQPSSITLTLP